MTEFLKKSGMYTILRMLYREEKSFSEFLNDVPRRTLADRLKELEKIGYVKRKVIMSHPVRVKYILTNKGREVFRELIRDRHETFMEDLYLAFPDEAEKIIASYIKEQKE
jgi:DNA-binding HxlR family transcriptional regulator